MLDCFGFSMAFRLECFVLRMHVLVCSWICGKATNLLEEFFCVGFLVGCRGAGVEWAFVLFLVHWRFV